MIYKTYGFILKRKDLAAVDRLLTVYSQDFGKFFLKARSIRKEASKLKGHLELFNLSHLMIAPGRGYDIVTGAESLTSFTALKKDSTKLAIAFYFADLIDKTVLGQEKDPVLWQLICAAFEALNKQNCPVQKLIQEFEEELVKSLGYSLKKDAFSQLQEITEDNIKSKEVLDEILK